VTGLASRLSFFGVGGCKDTDSYVTSSEISCFHMFAIMFIIETEQGVTKMFAVDVNE